MWKGALLTSTDFYFCRAPSDCLLVTGPKPLSINSDISNTPTLHRPPQSQSIQPHPTLARMDFSLKIFMHAYKEEQHCYLVHTLCGNYAHVTLCPQRYPMPPEPVRPPLKMASVETPKASETADTRGGCSKCNPGGFPRITIGFNLAPPCKKGRLHGSLHELLRCCLPL